MPTFFKKSALLGLLAFISSGCVQEKLEDFPPIERQGNVFALFEPGKPLQIQAAITGYSLDRVFAIDSMRVQSKLFLNNQLIESFNLRSQTRIELGKSYRLECLIDNEYPVKGTIRLPQDTLIIDSGRVKALPEPIPVVNSTGTGGYRLEFAETFTVNVPANYSDNEIYLSRGEAANNPFFSADFFSNGERVQVLSPPFPKEIVARKNNADSPVTLYQINAPYYHFLKQARDPLVEPEVIPGNVSVSNLEQGVGLIAYQIPYHR